MGFIDKRERTKLPTFLFCYLNKFPTTGVLQSALKKRLANRIKLKSCASVKQKQ